MPISPGLIPSPALFRRGRRSRLLFHFRGRDLSVNALSGQVGTFTRASAGGAVADRSGGLYVPVHSQPRWDVPVAGGETGWLAEYARTNVVLNSSVIDSTATWGGNTDFTVAAALSCLKGQVAYRHTNLNAAAFRARTQTVGVLSAAGDSVFCIIENVNADTTSIALFDVTLGTSVHLAAFTWATRVLATTSGAGSLFVRKLAEVGPNGGPLYLIGVSGLGTVGNSRRILIYPTGTTQNDKVAILHHGQLEVGAYPSSPIITTGASATRATDRLTFPLNVGTLTPETDDFTLYARFARPNHADAVGAITDAPGILALGGSAADIRLHFSQASRQLNARFRDSASTPAAATAGIPTGAVIEILAQAKDLVIAPAIAIDVGSGLSAFVTAGLLPITAFGTPVIGVGEITNGADKLGAPLFEAKVANSLLSLDQMREAF